MKVLKKSVPEISVYGATKSLSNVTKYIAVVVHVQTYYGGKIVV